MKRTQFGFTLIELMITVAIIGILASIAIPSYQDSVSKSRRADVKGVLVNLANAMERRFTQTNSYCDGGGGAGAALANCGGAGLDTGTPAGIGFAVPNETAAFYTVTISQITNIDATTTQGGGYTLSAAPTGAQANDKCGTLTLTHTGNKGNSSGTLAECW